MCRGQYLGADRHPDTRFAGDGRRQRPGPGLDINDACAVSCIRAFRAECTCAASALLWKQRHVL